MIGHIWPLKVQKGLTTVFVGKRELKRGTGQIAVVLPKNHLELRVMALEWPWVTLKVHKRENFLGSDIEICTF